MYQYLAQQIQVLDPHLLLRRQQLCKHLMERLLQNFFLNLMISVGVLSVNILPFFKTSGFLTNSLTNQTPIYAKDIEYQIRKMINLLKVEGKYLTPNDETKLNTAIDKLSDEEEKLKVLSKSFENMLMDPNFNPNNPSSFFVITTTLI